MSQPAMKIYTHGSAMFLSLLPVYHIFSLFSLMIKKSELNNDTRYDPCDRVIGFMMVIGRNMKSLTDAWKAVCQFI